MKFLFSVSSILSLLIPSITMAHPTMGVDVANAGIETIATSVPLPSLDGSSLVVTPQLGMITTELVNKPGVTEVDADYSGAAKGTSFGLALTFPTNTNFSYFGYAGYIQQTGEFMIDYETMPTVRYTDFKASGSFIFAALQYRAYGEAQSPMALGLFLGPALYSFQSDVTYDQENAGPPSSDLKFNPSGSGVLYGLQLTFRLTDFRINPYLISFSPMSDKCQKVEIPDGGQLQESSFTCGGTEGRAESPGGFGGLGVVLGYKSIRVKLLSLLPAQESQPLQVSSYAFAYSLVF